MTREFSNHERTLLEAAVTLTRRLDGRDTCTAVLEVAERLFAARSSWVLVHDPQADCLVTIDARGPAGEVYRGARIPSHTGIVGATFHQRRPVFRNARLLETVEQDRARLRRVMEQRQLLRTEVGRLRDRIRQSHSPVSLMGDCRAFRDVLTQVELVAPADGTVLLVGETGTGKELIARAVHDGSPRSGRAFVPVNCAAMPDTLVESELFAYEKGAFTGAQSRKAGQFEAAHHQGTLFVDEIGELPPFMLIQDVGLTFGEAGRRFLAGLLVRLSERQFTSCSKRRACISDSAIRTTCSPATAPSRSGSVLQEKRRQIVQRRC